MQCEYTKHFESVRRIRNACAHNVCMLASFKSVPGFKSDLETNFELLDGNIGIGNGTISSCMKVPLLKDFAVMLSVYIKLISSPKTHLLPIIPLLRHLHYNLHQGFDVYFRLEALVAALLTSIGEYDVSEYL